MVRGGWHQGEGVRLHVPQDGATRIAVVIGNDARVVVLEEMLGRATHAALCIADAHAHVDYVTLQSGNGPCRVTQFGSVGNEALLSWRAMLFGSDVELSLQSRVHGERGTSSVDWAFYGRTTDRQRLDCRNMFAGRDGAGEVLMKGVAEEKAHASCRGMIDIELGGNGTNTYLTQNVLMLDPTAKIDAIPGLEIKTNDVKASHSATVARVTPEDLFTFAARGIDAREARSMFIRGFLGEIAQRLPAGRAQAEAMITEKESR